MASFVNKEVPCLTLILTCLHNFKIYCERKLKEFFEVKFLDFNKFLFKHKNTLKLQNFQSTSKSNFSISSLQAPIV